MWFCYIKPLILEVQMMFFSTEANEGRFLGGRCIGAVEPIESQKGKVAFLGTVILLPFVESLRRPGVTPSSLEST